MLPKKIKKAIFYLIIVLMVFLVGCSANKVGKLGSTHIHADFKVYILGDMIDFGINKYQVKDRMVHVEDNIGEVIHIHATGITLGYFLNTLGFEINDECITKDTGTKYCNNQKDTLKAFVKGPQTEWIKLNNPPEHIIHEKDRILISFGNENEEEIMVQQNSVTKKSFGE